MESVWFRYIFSLLYCLSCVRGEIRCYCNEPKCVVSGYMCKSSKIEMCYVIVSYEGEVQRRTHGCLDTIVSQHESLCSAEELKHYKNDVKSRDKPLLRCCKEDMCNYNIDLVIHLQSNSSSSSSETSNPGPPPAGYNFPDSKLDTGERNPEKDLWFKAAVIAVPIAGGFILILLVLLAVRMLRTDSRRHRQFIQIRREKTSLTKAQLYVTDHFSDKIEKQTSPIFGEKHNPLCKDPNLKVDKDGKIYEKIGDKSNIERTYPSIIIWGKPTKKDFATVV